MSFENLNLERNGNIFILTMQKPPENRLNARFAQEIIRALRHVEKELGRDAEGAVIIKGNDAKFWCTVCFPAQISRLLSHGLVPW
jgi:Delta3-Delta2-enoyl-CoA isomerase